MLPQSAQSAFAAATSARAEHVKVEAKDSGGTWRNLSSYPGYNAVNAVTIEESNDGPHRTMNLTLKREEFDFSVAGLVASMVNPAGVTPLVEIGREIRVYLSVAPMGAAAEYTLVFHGIIDTVDDGQGDTTTVEATDLGARLARCQIECERAYGYGSPAGARIWAPLTAYVLNEYLVPAGAFAAGTSHYYKVTTAGTSGASEPTWPTGGGSTVSNGSCVFTEQGTTSGTGIAVETLIQEIVDDNIGSGIVALYVPSAPSWVIKPYLQQRQYVLEAITVLATQMGWDLRYKWKTGSSAFELTLYEPNRTVGSGDEVAVFTAAQYEGVSSLKRDITTIRNAIRVIYSDSAAASPNGNLSRKIIDVVDSGSITSYGRLYMELSEEETSQIDTSAEATALANAALYDLSRPIAAFEVSAYLFPWVELGDYYGFSANNRHFSQDQSLAVSAYRHEMSSGGDGGYKCRTTLTTLGFPALGPRKWIGQMGAGDRFTASGTGKEKHRIQDLPIVDALTLGASATVGGALFSVSGTMSKVSALVGQEVHVSPTANFTKDSSTLVATGDGRSFAVQNLYPGQAYYASLVPLSRNAGRIVRGSPTPETSFTAGRAGAGHLESTVDYWRIPLNGGFETQNDPAAPPDHWTMYAGDWGDRATLQSGSTGVNGNSWLNINDSSNTSTRLHSAAFGVSAAEEYILSAWVRGNSGASAFTIGIWWANEDFTFTGETNTTVVSVTVSVGTWRRVTTERQAAPSWARYGKAFIDTGVAHDFDVDAMHVVPVLPQEAWIDVATGLGFANSWVNYGSGWQAAEYMKDSNGFVHLRGMIKTGTLTAAAFTLPAFYRPAAKEYFACESNNAHGALFIDTSGNVTPQAGSNTFFSLSGISYRVA